MMNLRAEERKSAEINAWKKLDNLLDKDCNGLDILLDALAPAHTANCKLTIDRDRVGVAQCPRCVLTALLEDGHEDRQAWDIELRVTPRARS